MVARDDARSHAHNKRLVRALRDRMNILSLACLTAVADGGSIYADEYGVTWQVQGGKRVAVQIGDSEPLSIADMPASFQANLEAAVAGMAAGYNLAMAACNQTGLTADLSRRVQENEASAVESELRTNAVQQLAETNQATVLSMIECFGKGLLIGNTPGSSLG